MLDKLYALVTGYWSDIVDRAAKSAAESALLVIAADKGFNALEADWQLVGGFAAGGAVLAVLVNVAQRGIFGRRS